MSEKEMRAIINESKEYSELAGTQLGNTDYAWNLMKLAKLDRIADALEGINSSLSEISVSLDSIDRNLESRISANGNNCFLCIAGNVYTG